MSRPGLERSYGRSPGKRRVLSLVSVVGLVAALTFVAAAPAGAVGITVDCGANPSALQPAIDAAPIGSALDVTGICTGYFTIAKDLTLQGFGGATLDGGYEDTRLIVSAGNVNLNGIRVTNGGYEGCSCGVGGISNSGELTLNNAMVDNNTGYDGGGIFNDGTLVVADSTVSGNGTGSGGGSGSGINNTGTLTVTNSTISGNGATDSGGGIWNEGTATITGSLLSNNYGGGGESSGDGGGIANEGHLTIVNSIVSNNEVGVGNAGGIWNENTMTITNTTISGNYDLGEENGAAGGGVVNEGTMSLADSSVSGNWIVSYGGSHGGGIANFGKMSVEDSTVTGNSVVDYLGPPADSGGGIENGDRWQGPGTLTLVATTVSGNSALATGGIENTAGTVTLRGSILAGNSGSTGADCSGTVSSLGYNLVGDTRGCTFTKATGDKVGPVGGVPIDPKLGALGNNGGLTETVPLLPGSPAIDMVRKAQCKDANGLLLHTDQRGMRRPIGGGCDAGAFEAPGPDGLVGNLPGGSLVGDGIYNGTGNSQTRLATIKRSTSVSFAVQVQNDGAGPDAFSLKGTGDISGVGSVRYLSGTTDITSKVKAGTYKTANLAPGQTVNFTIVITGSPSVSKTVVGKWLLTARSAAAPTLLDAVAAKVTVMP